MVRESNRWVEHSYEVSSQTRLLNQSFNDMENNHHKYLISGNEDTLGLFSKSIEENKLIDMLNKYLASPDHQNSEKAAMTIETPNDNPIPNESTSTSTSTNEDKIWDEEDFLQRVRGRTDRALKLMDSFEKSVPEEIELLKHAIEQNDENKIVELSHKIKGVAGNLSAVQLAKNMSAIEDAYATHNIEKLSTLSDEIDTLLSDLAIQFDEARLRFSN